MAKMVTIQRLRYAPTLNTVIMVENVIKNSKNSIITIPEIKRALPRQVNHTKLKTILEYLEKINKIAITMKGITWIHSANPNLKRAIERGMET